MPGHLDILPRRQVREDRLRGRGKLLLEPDGLVRGVLLAALLPVGEVLDLPRNVLDRLLEGMYLRSMSDDPRHAEERAAPVRGVPENFVNRQGRFDDIVPEDVGHRQDMVGRFDSIGIHRVELGDILQDGRKIALEPLRLVRRKAMRASSDR